MPSFLARCLFAVAIVAPACAARTTPAEQPVRSDQLGQRAGTAAPRSDPAALVAEGCFTCLQDALAAAAAEHDDALVFEIASLLALRAKELGMPANRWNDLAAAAQPIGRAWALYAEIVAAIPPDPLGGDREVLLTQTVPRRQIAAALDLWRASLREGPGTAMFRAYLQLSLACPFVGAEEWAHVVEETTATLGDAPLVQYRVGFCGGEQDAPRLYALRIAHPKFADADYALGRLALQSAESPDEDEALRRFRAAAAAFPDSSAILTSLGQVHESREEWTEALAAHDAALALVPTHRDSLLGRTIALSNLLRREEAIASATRLVELGNWFIGQAYYWRAWNHFHLEAYGPARADADSAKAAVSDPAVLVLSGMIDWRQRRLPSAEREFTAARQLDAQQCEAGSFLGAVLAEQSRLSEALATFVDAKQCFATAIEARRETIAKIDSSRASEDTKRRQRDTHERAIADATGRRDEADANEKRLRQQLGSAPARVGG